MTEFETQPPYYRDDTRRQLPKPSSSNSWTLRRLADTLADDRVLTQTVDKMDGRSKNYTSVNKELNRKSIPIPGDISYKRSMDEKSNGQLLEDYKILRKSDIRPSDSSYSRKVSWDASISAETSSLFGHSSKSHQVRHVKQDGHVMYLAEKYNNKAISDNHRKKTDPFCIDKRKTVENPFSHLAEIAQMNGTSHDSHSNSLPIYRTVDQRVVNSFLNSDLCRSLSRESSHLQSNGSDASNLLPTSHDRHPAFSKERPMIKYLSPPLSQYPYLSPTLNRVPLYNPKDKFLAAMSQKIAASEESTSRPNSSFRGEEENSNDDKSLAVNFSNPTTNSADTVTPTPEKSRYPYSIEMKEGMFKTVKTGPEHETLKIHIIENFGSGDLKDGGFSWGWSIEQRSSAQPSPKTSSATREKNYASANKDIHKSKRRLEYEKASSSPSHKKSKVKGSSSEVQDITRCREKSYKEIKSKSNHIPSKHSSPHIKQSYMHGEKSTTKSSKSSLASPTVANKSPSAVRSLNFDRHCEFAASPLERRKSPIYVPLSEMVPLPKTDCLGKSNNVIDDSTMGFISSKKERSAVYSGRKSALEVQPLKVMCFEAVKKNLLSLKIGQNVPFELLMPALKLCSPSKLLKIEEHNWHIVRRTDCLWRKFCESEFRDQKRLNGEAWKDVYWRARNLREKKLKNLAASISNGMAKAHPERQAKWVGIGTNNPEKRQRKIKVEEVHRIEEIPIPKPEANGKGSGSSSSHKEPPAKKRSGSESSSSESPHSAHKPTSLSKSQVPKAAKKTLAPLMSKTKKMLNLVNRRR